MDDRLKETLSAMMDDEADELSVRRLLSNPSQQDVRSQLQRWQQVRDLMQRGPSSMNAVDVRDSVRQRLEGHEARVDATVDAAPVRSHWRWSAMAIVLALAIGFGAGSNWDADGEGSVAVADASVAVEGTEVPQIALKGLTEDQRRQLSRYLLEHAQHSSVSAAQGSVGYARAASLSGSEY